MIRIWISVNQYHWTSRPSNKTPAPATCWSRHSSRGYWQIPICVFLWSVKCQHCVRQQCLLHQRYKVWTFIGQRQAAGGCSWRQSTLLAAGYISRQALSADFRGWYELLIVQWHRTKCKTGYCNSRKSDPPCHIQFGRRRISPVSGKLAGSVWLGWITVRHY